MARLAVRGGERFGDGGGALSRDLVGGGRDRGRVGAGAGRDPVDLADRQVDSGLRDHRQRHSVQGNRAADADDLDLGLRPRPVGDADAAQHHPAVDHPARHAQHPGPAGVLVPDLEQLHRQRLRHAEHPAHPRPVRRRVLQRHALELHRQRLRRAAELRLVRQHRHHQGAGQRDRRTRAGCRRRCRPADQAPQPRIDHHQRRGDVRHHRQQPLDHRRRRADHSGRTGPAYQLYRRG